MTISRQPVGVMEARLKRLVWKSCKSCLYINDGNLSNNQRELKMFSLGCTYFMTGLDFMTGALISIALACEMDWEKEGGSQLWNMYKM